MVRLLLLPLAVIAGLMGSKMSVATASGAQAPLPTPTPDSAAEVEGQRPIIMCQHCNDCNCQCGLVCCPQRVIEKEKKSYWKVTCKRVCIPGFRFPWEYLKRGKCSGGHDCREGLVCGTVRAVNVLEEHEYECEKCGYEWEVKCVCAAGEDQPARGPCPRCAQHDNRDPPRR